MSIMPDPIKTKGHFGNTPIQGKTNLSLSRCCARRIYAIKISQSSSQTEIANILHVSAGTVNNDIHTLGNKQNIIFENT